MTRDKMSKLVGVVAVLIVGTAMSVMACGGDEKKPPLTPDTPAADDMAEAGAPATPSTETPAAPASATPEAPTN